MVIFIHCISESVNIDQQKNMNMLKRKQQHKLLKAF
jgi:hypothetical protein